MNFISNLATLHHNWN